jgi:hypothetical protein
MYYSNGVTWEYSESPYQATLSEVNTGTNTDKFVSPYTFTNADKWGNYTLKTTTISTTSPLQGGGDLSANRTFSITQANATTNGYLSSADWNTFSGKQNTITLTTTGSSGASTFITNTLNVPTYTLSGLGGVPTSRQLTINGTALDLSADRSWSVGTVTSVGLTMPTAFTVTNSPITGSGVIAVTGAGLSSQYIRGDGQLATFPTSGGGSSVLYYLNGSINASVVGYKQLDNIAIIGVGTDFTLTGNGLITQFLTNVANPNRNLIPSGAWNFEMFFSMSSNGGVPKFYVELLKYNGTTFTSIASTIAIPESITGGTTIDLYLTSLAVPETVLLTTDRLAVRVYIVDNSGGRTATLHTEDNHLCQIITTFSGGISSLNGLTANTQYLAVGTSGTDFNISSVTDTHTFNLPTASATNRGALSSADWTTFNNKQDVITLGNLTNASSDGITITGGTNAVNGTGVEIFQQVSNATQNGYLSSTDWNTFNSASPSFIPALPLTSYPQGYYANNGSATLSIVGNVNTAALSGTASLNSIAGTNTLTRTVRITIPTSSTAGSKAGVRTAALRHSVGQGFMFSVCWAIQDAAYVAGAKQFHGLLPISTLSTINNLIDVSSLTNFVGIGSDASDLNLQIFYNDATGVASQIDLGSNFPANRTAGAVMNNVYVFEMYNEPNTLTVKYRITERSSGNTAQGELTTDLPDITVLLGSQAIRTNGASTLATVTQWSYLIGYII